MAESKSFEAQISDWVAKSLGRIEAVFKQSAQEVFLIAQTPVGAGGNMPVDTGFLRASLQTGLNGASGVKGVEGYVFVIAGAKLGDTIFGGWTADYAVHVHYGTHGRAGRLWVDLAAQQWQDIVTKFGREAEARST